MNLFRLIIIAFFIFLFAGQRGFCAANYSVDDVLIDNSDRMILIKGTGNYKNGLETVQIPTAGANAVKLINNITPFTITAPARYVLDIPNAVLKGSSRTYTIKNSTVLQNIQLAQFSANPNIVRVVFTLQKATDLPKFKTYTDGSNIVIKYSSNIIDNSMQYKFYTPLGDSTKDSKLQNTSAVVTYNNSTDIKEIVPNFQTKYYLSQVSQNSDGLILRGIGMISHQRANYSQDGLKAWFLLDNTSISAKLDNKTYRIPSSQNDNEATLTINRLNSRKVKLTLDGKNIRDYRFVVSPDGQSLFISHRNFIINTIFSSNPAVVKGYKAQTTQSGYKLFEVIFDKSVAYNVFEMGDNFYLDVNNLGDYNTTLFEQMLQKNEINVQALKISSDKTRFIVSTKELNFAYANVESNAKSIKLCFKQKPEIIVDNNQPQKQPEIVIATTNEQDKDKEQKVNNNENINIIYIPKEDVTKVEKPKKPKEKPTISAMKKVVIDPGHGGADSGAIGGGVYEKTLNLEVAKMVQERLMKKDVYVYMTRTKDETLSLEDRVNYSNEINPDIFVSIHTNSTVKEDTFGLETHYFKDNSYDLARVIHSEFASDKNVKKWDTKDRGVIKSRFYVINHTEAPSVLIEIGFISNLEERARLLKKGRREDIAESIADGILEYLKVK